MPPNETYQPSRSSKSTPLLGDIGHGHKCHAHGPLMRNNPEIITFRSSVDGRTLECPRVGIVLNPQCHETKDLEVPISFHGAASPIEKKRSPTRQDAQDRLSEEPCPTRVDGQSSEYLWSATVASQHDGSATKRAANVAKAKKQNKGMSLSSNSTAASHGGTIHPLMNNV
ncbi:hypothetical protein PIIN_09262 [Serendipita indica DSM 11827]|uniref:Uncharacterized protein n=1 Tax=Serendipita indica (strain DSM 11827) TaxID=1109443 RepID=G4TVD5_SERID|nr:hypothetical protein PIIN_09262 [Serendipita indica DSM 11827]